MRSFVIQKHTKTNDCHFDLMLEEKGKLLTWSINNTLLFKKPWKPIKCRKLTDHKIKYLTYEGKISRGRGYVRIADKGKYLTSNKLPSFFTLQLHGIKTKGFFFCLKDTIKKTEWWIAKIE